MDSAVGVIDLQLHAFGIISRKMVPIMKPDPTAMKYRRDFFRHFWLVTMTHCPECWRRGRRLRRLERA
jgi:hypothetical protein